MIRFLDATGHNRRSEVPKHLLQLPFTCLFPANSLNVKFPEVLRTDYVIGVERRNGSIMDFGDQFRRMKDPNALTESQHQPCHPFKCSETHRRLDRPVVVHVLDVQRVVVEHPHPLLW